MGTIRAQTSPKMAHAPIFQISTNKVLKWWNWRELKDLRVNYDPNNVSKHFPNDSQQLTTNSNKKRYHKYLLWRKNDENDMLRA